MEDASFNRTGERGNTERNQNEDAEQLAERLFKSGVRLGMRFSQTKALEDIDQAIIMIREAASLMPHRVGKAMLLDQIGFGLSQRYSHTGDKRDLDGAIQAAREAVVMASMHTTLRGEISCNLSCFLGTQYKRTNDLSTLQEAITTAREALASAPSGTSTHAKFLSNLGNRMSERHTHTGAEADLDEAIELTKRAMQELEGEDPAQIRMSGNLGLELLKRFVLRKDTSDLEESIILGTRAVNECHAIDPNRYGWLINLGNALKHRFGVSKQQSDIDQAIRLLRSALNSIPIHHQDRAGILTHLAEALGDKFSSTENREDNEEALTLISEAVERTSESHPDCSDRLNVLGVALGRRFAYTKELEDLDRAIENFKESFELAHVEKSTGNKQIDNMLNALDLRYKTTLNLAGLDNGQTVDFEKAVNAAREAVTLTMPGDERHAERLMKLIQLLEMQYSITGEHQILDEGIEKAKEVVANTRSSNLDIRPSSMDKLGFFLQHAFQKSGNLAYVDESISVTRESLKYTSSDDLEGRSRRLSCLGLVLGLRFEGLGELADLDEAIRCHRESVHITPLEDPGRPVRLCNLSVSLRGRFRRTGLMEDLNESIQATEDAISSTPDPISPKQKSGLTMLMVNLAVEIFDRSIRIGSSTDLDRAIELAKETIVHRDPNRAHRLSNLGTYLRWKFSRSKDVRHIDEAVKYLREALAELSNDDDSGRAVTLDNLATALDDRSQLGSEVDDVEEGIQLGREALRITPDNHPSKAILLVSLGTMLERKFSHTKQEFHHRNEAKELFLEALKLTNGEITSRVLAGLRYISASSLGTDGRQMCNAAKAVIDLIPLWVPLSLKPSDKQYLLSSVVGHSSNAAAISLHVGESPLSAVRLLEAGRGVITGSVQDLRTNVSVLHDKKPELARRFTEIRKILDASSKHVETETFFETEGLDVGSMPNTFATDRRHNFSGQMSGLLEEIRRIPDFENFLIAGSETELRQAAIDGPIIVINVSSYRCDALVIQQGGIEAIELPRLRRDDIIRRSPNTESLETLEWLWDDVVSPILAFLGFVKTPACGQTWPHVWWIPTGPLVRFPLHAAGYHLRGDSSSTLDRVVSSYSSSIKAITTTRRERLLPKNTNRDSSAVLIAMPDTPGQGALWHASNEIGEVKAICESMKISCIEPESKQQGVLEALSSCKLFHFAGHGGSNPIDPLQSRLLLDDWQDHPLTVENLFETKLQDSQPFLAYLSACGTSQIRDASSIDESIHLASAFQLAGFRHVIGTLWDVEDALCVDVARAVYENLRDHGIVDGSVSIGLHLGLRMLRDRWVISQAPVLQDCQPLKSSREDGDESRGLTLDNYRVVSRPLWVPYVHFGV
ncbi:hypothetical protein CMUS01_03357 [Colletotrichum musicola]|uniref:CHAT domain-containing protein n=1 Tax=Colletotrichum musicola TaxID=2175873 RepID=A0A8H6NTH4_9PEZI|nr:hypothetical protein CMUS01_03357 [Colletotrichum musicola]